MKILGAILMISGLLISIVSYGTYGNVVCHCPEQITGQPSNCHCEDNLEQHIGRIMTYVGIVIVSVGIILSVYGWRSKEIK